MPKLIQEPIYDYFIKDINKTSLNLLEVIKQPLLFSKSSKIRLFNPTIDSTRMSSKYLLKVKDIVRETEDAVSVYFHHPSEGKIEYQPGQFFTLIFNINGEEVRRAYSLCTSPFTDEFPAVTVKRVEAGRMSGFINSSLKPGDMVEVLAPKGSFTTTFEPNRKRRVVFFGGGSGITPLMSLAKSILHQEPESEVLLVYANRNEHSIIFKAQLEDLENRYKNRFRVIHILEAPRDPWSGLMGLLSAEKVKAILADFSHDAFKNEEYFICGPEAMMDVVISSLKALDIPADKIRKESFFNTSAPQASPAEELLREYEVKVIYDSEEHVFPVKPDETILDAALDRDIELPYSCRSGLCTACRGKCLSGKVLLDEKEGLSEREMQEGYVLTCVGHPLTPDVVIEIG